MSMLILPLFTQNLKQLFIFVSNSEVMYMTENMYSMVLFSFQGNSNAEERVWNKKVSGSCIQVQIFF